MEEGEVERSDHGVRVYYARIGLRIELIEHLAAALAGLGIRRGIRIQIEGGEVPLLDGGARDIATALGPLAGPTPPALRVAHRATVTVGESAYHFDTAPRQDVEVWTDFKGVGEEHATWDGSRVQFLERIAPARTFGFLADGDALRRAGRAAWIDPEAVLVLNECGESVLGGRPREPGELARHKLLDLLGDLYLLGGPPLGKLVAHRPGHTRNRLAFRTALESGIVVPVSPEAAARTRTA